MLKYTYLPAQRVVFSDCPWEGGKSTPNWLLQSNAVCTKIFNEYAVKIKPTKEIVIQFYWFIFQFIKLTH